MSDDTKIHIAWAFVAAVALVALSWAARSCSEDETSAYVECIKASGKPLECERTRAVR